MSDGAGAPLVNADRVAGATLCVAALGVALAAATIEVLPGLPTLSARFFPWLLAAVLGASGLTLALRPGDGDLRETLSRLFAARAVALAALLLLYALSFRHVDFRIGTWAFVASSMWVLGSRRATELLLVPALVAAVVYTTFRYGFSVLLPVWTW